MVRSGRGGGAEQASDPRAVETRRRLVRAFVELSADDQPARELTVPMIAGRAHLHRSSFYAHFDTIDDLALFALECDLGRIHAENLARHSERSVPAATSNAEVIAQILDQVSTPSSHLSAVLRHDRALAEAALGEQLRDRVIDYYAQLPTFAQLTEASRTVSADYIGHGLAAVICGWLAGELGVGKPDLTRWLALLVPDWVMAAAPTAGAGSELAAGV